MSSSSASSPGNSTALAVLVLDDRSTAEILLAGCIDRTTDAALDQVVTRLLIDPQVQRIEVDVALVRFCDSGGLATFIRAHYQAANFGVPLHLVQAGPFLRRILEITGLSQLLLATS